MKKRKEKIINALFTTAIVVCFCVTGLLMYRNICYSEIIVSGSSMETTLHNNELGYIKTTNSAKRNIKRFDIIVIKLKDDYEIIKRVVGLPGEKLLINEDGKLSINGQIIEQSFISSTTISKTYIKDAIGCKEELIIPDNEYYVLGDNRGNSSDSRNRGTFTFDSIDGVLKVITKQCDDNKVCKSITPRWY